MMFSSEFGFEITAIAQFGDNVTVSIGCKYLMALQDVRMTKFLQHIDF